VTSIGRHIITIEHGVILKGMVLGPAQRLQSLWHKHQFANQRTTGVPMGCLQRSVEIGIEITRAAMMLRWRT